MDTRMPVWAWYRLRKMWKTASVGVRWFFGGNVENGIRCGLALATPNYFGNVENCLRWLWPWQPLPHGPCELSWHKEIWLGCPCECVQGYPWSPLHREGGKMFCYRSTVSDARSPCVKWTQMPVWALPWPIITSDFSVNVEIMPVWAWPWIYTEMG